jgi:putative DNA methylase
VFPDGQALNPSEHAALVTHLAGFPALVPEYDREWIADYIFVRQVICPHCGGEAPLLNAFWLSKKEDERWGLAVETNPQGKTVSFRPYRVVHSRRDGNKTHYYGPRGEEIIDEDSKGTITRTVTDGVGTCVHCKQAIAPDEVKAQARGESAHGVWTDRLYAVVAVRHQPKLDQHGQPQRYKTGPRKGEIKTEKVRFFRAPNARDLDAIAAAEARLKAQWPRWEAEGLIPTEEIPEDSNYNRGHRLYGLVRWCDLFTSRQLIGHLYLAEALNRLKPDIVKLLGSDMGRAVATYLQLACDKVIDYNSKMTRWEYTRGVVKGTFSRHDFSLKWTFGEMIFSGPQSGAAWGLSQIVDAVTGLTQLLAPVHAHRANGGGPSLRIINGTAAHMN